MRVGWVISLHPQMILADLVETRELHHIVDFGIASTVYHILAFILISN